jgi:uncharacterized protein YdhG (YjbR/CyaY superfamily)
VQITDGNDTDAASVSRPPAGDPQMKPAGVVDAYIGSAPKEVRRKLREVRAAIRAVAPDAVESISYGMPGYDKGRVAWFGLMKSHIGLYLRPPIIEEHKHALAGYKTTTSAVHFPLDTPIPAALIKTLVRARIKRNAARRSRPRLAGFPRGQRRRR